MSGADKSGANSKTPEEPDDFKYKMKHERRGNALIFNQESFFHRLNGVSERRGTNVDRDKLKERLEELNFKVEVCDNFTNMQVLNKIGEVAEEDHSDADCFLLAFLSHGEDNCVYTYDARLKIQDITSPFKGDRCRSLVGKPKIFILQACRGHVADDPVTGAGAGTQAGDTVMDACAIQTLPAGADFIMCYSVAEGYFSFRNESCGSWYIQDLCELLKDHGKSLEFTELLTWVNRKVSMRSVERPSDKKLIGKKQIPCFASMLTKKLYFHPK